MFGSGSKYKIGDKWFVKAGCNGYEKGTLVVIVDVLGYGRKKKLCVRAAHENPDAKAHKVSYKTMWKKCK